MQGGTSHAGWNQTCRVEPAMLYHAGWNQSCCTMQGGPNSQLIEAAGMGAQPKKQRKLPLEQRSCAREFRRGEAPRRKQLTDQGMTGKQRNN